MGSNVEQALFSGTKSAFPDGDSVQLRCCAPAQVLLPQKVPGKFTKTDEQNRSGTASLTEHNTCMVAYGAT